MKDTAKAFILEKGKTNEEGNLLTVAQTDRSKFLSDHGIPKATQDKMDELNVGLYNGGIEVASEMLQSEVAKFKKENKDPNTATAVVKLMRSDGKDEVRITGCRTYPNPQNPGAQTEVYGNTKLVATRNRLVDDEVVKSESAKIKKAILG